MLAVVVADGAVAEAADPIGNHHLILIAGKAADGDIAFGAVRVAERAAVVAVATLAQRAAHEGDEKKQRE
jgi:hypothetical protein